jgi:bacillopeptidase F
VLALLRDAIPPAGVEELEAALIGSATDIAAFGPDNDSGYGIVNAVGALDLLAYPVDIDGDGYGPTTDCDDNDASVYPGAPEIARDGIDQDCNGYDLSMKVHYAVYSHDGATLRIRVTSGLKQNAALEVVGMGPLIWREHYEDWYIADGAINGYDNPTITLRGTEGDMQVTPRKPLPRRD